MLLNFITRIYNKVLLLVGRFKLSIVKSILVCKLPRRHLVKVVPSLVA